jgi:HAE1 family hydrophobic/amphiphilic exporter-1
LKLAEISIRRPVFALILILSLVVLGLVSLARLELQLDPELEYPIVTVTTELRGASPETIEMEVSDVLEEEINSLEGIRLLQSSSSDGLSDVIVEFELEYDPDLKIQEVRDKVALARPRLPIDIEEPQVTKWNINAQPIMIIMLGGRVSLRELSDLAEHDIMERLERLPGVGAVTPLGSRKREIRIWLDPLRLSGYDLSIDDVATTLRRENAELAGGRIESPELEWSVTMQGKVRSVEDFGTLIVAQRGDRLVHLGDRTSPRSSSRRSTTSSSTS